MSIQTFTRTLFRTSIPAILAYFSVMFIGDHLARAEKKPASIETSAASSTRIQVLK